MPVFMDYIRGAHPPAGWVQAWNQAIPGTKTIPSCAWNINGVSAPNPGEGMGRWGQEGHGGIRSGKEGPGEGMRGQGGPGGSRGVKRGQDGPRGSRRDQEGPLWARRGQERPEGARMGKFGTRVIQPRKEVGSISGQ